MYFVETQGTQKNMPLSAMYVLGLTVKFHY